MKKLFTLSLFILAVSGLCAQNWQATTEKFWGKYCFRELNGQWYNATTEDKVMTEMPTDPNMVLAYYWRIPEGKVRADIIWKNAYARYAKMHVRVIRPTTGEVLVENDLTNTTFLSEERTTDLFGTLDFPGDEFYRVEISSPNWSYIKQISYFIFQHESEKPVMKPRNYGGTSGHMWNWASTDPDAPSGNAYDWAYIESRVPYEYQYPGTYYMTIGALAGYMGMQTVGRMGEDDFSRSVLFSVWDNGNMDEDPNLPEYMQSGVMSGNPDAVHTHAGGEGSSASVMLKGSTKWWRPDKWVQFLENTRPETITIFGQTRDGRDTSFIYENTICTAFYKMDDEPTWRYLATIRSSGQNNHMSGWYNFIEPFTSYAGQFKHRVLHRHPAMRAANSGKWYSRNKVDFWDEKYDRDFHYDYGRGASQEYENCFFFEMGGYGLQTDSSKITNLAKDMSFVESINFDSLNAIIDLSVKRDQRILFNTKVDQTADNYPVGEWTAIVNQSTKGNGPDRCLDGDEKTGWICGNGYPYTLALQSAKKQVVTSFNIYWEYKYDFRCLYVDLATSEDGETWTPAFDSLEIRSGIDRPNISFPHPVETKYLKLTFYHPFTTQNFMISELQLRGDYNKERLLNLAKMELENANGLNHYPAKDLEEAKAAYNNGSPASLTELALALKGVANQGTFYKYARVANKIHISSQRAYIFQNTAGHGVLGIGANGQLGTSGATISGALEKNATPADITNPLNNWMVLHDEHYSAYYLYNLGAKKFLNLTASSNLSDTPQEFSITASGGGYAFTANKEYIGVNATLQSSFSTQSKVNQNTTFFLYDNYQLAQTQTVRDSLQQITEVLDKVALYKASIENMVNAPVGVVGGFVSEEARETLLSAYAAATRDPNAFIEAVENADIIEFAPENTLYRIRSVYESNTPYMTADQSQRLVGTTQGRSLDQIWRFQPKGGGYSLHSQGLMPKPMPYENEKAITLTSKYPESGTYVLSADRWAENYISSAQHYKYTINGATSPMKTANIANMGSTWYLEPVTTYDISLNQAGVSPFYADFAFEIPQGLNVYVANHVTSDGVIKLSQITGIVPPGTPVLLKGESYEKFTLNILNSADALEAANIFKGAYFRTTSMTKGTFFTLATQNGQAVMKKPAVSLVSANQIYLPYEAGIMPDLSVYTFDFDNIVDSIEETPASTSNVPAPIYDLQGRRVPTTVKGNIYIRNHKAVRVK